MDLQEVGWSAMDWIDLAPDRNEGWEFVNGLSGSVKCGEFLD